MTDGNGSGNVVYTTKELIQNLDHKVDLILEELRGKVGSNLFDRLEERVSLAETAKSPVLAILVKDVESLKIDVEALRRGEVAQRASLSTAQKIWATAISITAVCSPIIVALIVHSHAH